MARTVAEVDKELRETEARVALRERVADVHGNRTFVIPLSVMVVGALVLAAVGLKRA